MVGAIAARKPEIYLGPNNGELVQGRTSGRAFCPLKSSQTGKTYAIALTCILFAANICGAYGANNRHNYQTTEWSEQQKMAVGVIVFIIVMGVAAHIEAANPNRNHDW